MEECETESDVCQIDTISHTLTTAPHIVKGVLSYLSAKDISLCARVCRLWADTVNVLKQRRKTLSWTCLDCEEGGSDSVQQNLDDFFQTVYSQPSIVFMFCQTDLHDDPIRVPSPSDGHRGRSRLPRASKRKKAEIGQYVKSLLPKDCELVGMTTDGIVGTSSDLSQRYEYEGRKGVSFLTLPKLDGVEIEVSAIDNFMVVDDLVNLELLTRTPKEKDVKLILFIAENPDWSNMIGYSLLRLYKTAAIAGGYVDNLIQAKPCNYPGTEGSLPSLMCVTFSGPNVQVATIVIKETVQSEEGFEKEVKRLKNCNLPEENSFAFMFACVGRGCGLYDKEDVETSIFKKHFPRTPLIGFFGNGEVGFNSFPNAENSGNESVGEARDKIQMFHAYTTILCFLSVI